LVAALCAGAVIRGRLLLAVAQRRRDELAIPKMKTKPTSACPTGKVQRDEILKAESANKNLKDAPRLADAGRTN